MQFLWVLILHCREVPEQEVLRQVVEGSVRETLEREEVKQMGKTMAQVLVEQGLEQGLEQGSVRGRQAMLFDLLEAKFGEVPPEVREAVQAIEDTETLRRLQRQALWTERLEDLEIPLLAA
jgi:hypothetical protein